MKISHGGAAIESIPFSVSATLALPKARGRALGSSARLSSRKAQDFLGSSPARTFQTKHENGQLFMSLVVVSLDKLFVPLK